MNPVRRTLLGALGYGGALLAQPALAAAGRNPQAAASRPAETWQTGSAERPLQLANLLELEEAAAKVIPAAGFDYIAGGAEDEWTLRENRAAFGRKQVAQRVLTGKVVTDTATTILGSRIAMPVIIAPMGGHGIAHVSAEAGTARGAAAAGTLHTVSTVATLSLEEAAQAADGPRWFQIYLTNDDGFNAELLQRARAAGYNAIVFTVDVPVGGNRDRDRRNGFVYPAAAAPRNFLDASGRPRAIDRGFKSRLDADSIDFVKRHSGLPVVVKGVAAPDDARLALDAGAAGIQVSNHGGRQLDGTPAAFSVLPAIADAVQGRVPLIFDSGVRRGTDVFKALASGADVVALGRPVLYGLALGGWQGVQSVLQQIERELRTVMQLAGAATVDDIRRTGLIG
ncbi:alpha-hydroxy-acid oxidizing protein [Thauera linaloolentis]|uniref:FMN hydroxy acid dehydrogenase domain-containing protein n=1 Tax=Thauera linaloolentis (strain DSM 12138 / JCM 21573 / CCUG 41526 / CIP 105981 / IAM 15112 / NBRC 102519 / 47Lol) TaxID=1123367 RepID=N6Z4D9_THAL4|nr:alpha-hydroxy-acid oxidizing protein [Thauera linaloolentis]ENO89432.1 hypothetical protein C666_05915 [Thauera linaloolentis 47Lol = DSM 12138]MCM8566931.1 alpha-hydroxy-acid oxidizing protein [Thauera linaloolentis]